MVCGTPPIITICKLNCESRKCEKYSFVGVVDERNILHVDDWIEIRAIRVTDEWD